MRNIPEDNIAIPVLINLSNGGSGSGFRLRTDTHIYLITARHVIFDEKFNIRADNAELSSPSPDHNNDTPILFNINLTKLHAAGNVFFHKTKDVAAICMGVVKPAETTGQFKCVFLENVTRVSQDEPLPCVYLKSQVRLMKDVLLSNDVYLYGYPSSLGLRKSPQFEYSKPLLRKGIVANAYPKLGTIILDCPVYYGNSGGAIVQVTEVSHGNFRHEVIGVVSQFIPYSETWKNQNNGLIHEEWTNSGYSVAIAMDYVIEILNAK